MKKTILASVILIALGFGAYVKFSDPIVLNINNQTNLASEIQWTCDSKVNNDKIAVAAHTKLEKKIYPGCGGKFGIILTDPKEAATHKLIGYVPKGRSERVNIVLANSNKVLFNLEDF